MIKPENIRFDNIILLCPNDSCIFVGCHEQKEYNAETGTYTNKVAGYSIEVALPDQSYEKIAVRLPLTCKVDKLKSGDKISFKGFNGRFYKNFKTGEYAFSASAEDIEVLSVDF